ERIRPPAAGAWLDGTVRRRRRRRGPLSGYRGGRRRLTYPGPMKNYAVVFLSVLLAEMGDKTQLATLLYATDPAVSKAGIFVAAAGGVVVSTLLAVTVGAEIARWVPPRLLKTVAGVGFIVVGLWVVLTR